LGLAPPVARRPGRVPTQHQVGDVARDVLDGDAHGQVARRTLKPFGSGATYDLTPRRAADRGAGGASRWPMADSRRPWSVIGHRPSAFKERHGRPTHETGTN